MKIGLANSSSKVTIEVSSPADLVVDGKQVSVSPGQIVFTATSTGFNVSAGGLPQANGSQATLSTSGEPLRYEGRSYRGRFIVQGGSSLRVINEVMIDDWLKGVLPAEIGSDSPVEALKAQAVAGRSEAIFRLASPPHKSEGYDFCTGVHCQAYKGIIEETPQIRNACDQTLGYILVAGDDVLNAVYHNVCGGVTAGAEEVWDSKPIEGLSPVFDRQKGSVVDLSDESAVRQFLESPGTDDFCYPGNPGYANYAKKYHRWSKSMTASELGKAAGVGTATDVQVTQRMRSGRVRKLTIQGTAGTKTFDKELNIRHALDLWSGLFVVDIQKTQNGGLNYVAFKGAGNGHGVGLCQHGAREIARRGGRFDQILGLYYPGAKVQKVYRP